jgi:O-Antigen ligase
LLFAVNVKLLIKMLGWVCAALVLGLCLFGAAPVFLSGNFLSQIFQEVLAVIHDPQTQWLILLCACFYFITFTLLQQRVKTTPFWHLDARESCLTALLLLGAFSYIINFPASAQSTGPLVLFVGVALGKGAGVWTSWRQEYSTARRVNVTIVILFVLMLGFSSLWHPAPANIFQYRGQTRWTGLWDNPNIFGLLMGTGIVLAVGLLVQSLMSKVQGGKSEDRDWHSQVGRYWRWIFAVLCLIAVGLMARGLLHSYSRGAWVATLFGLGYLLWWNVQCPMSNVRSHWTLWFKKNRFPLSTILIAVVILCFWQFRQTDAIMVKRVLSVGNMSDFSWRNRVSAWEGTLQIMAEHPMLGTGRNKPESLYEHYYLSPKMDESAAITLNDYLMLGATLGVPALICFGAYIWLSLTRKPDGRGQISDGAIPSTDLRPPASDLLQATCSAGAIVLLVGFWFDGGLFNLPTATMFWVLLELGAVELSQKCRVLVYEFCLHDLTDCGSLLMLEAVKMVW